MKKSILLLILFYLFYGQTQAQSQYYTPFPTDSAVWIAVRSGILTPGGGPPIPYYYERHYTLDGSDTTANSHTYKKIILRSFGGYFSALPVPAISSHPDRYIGAIRENANRQIYFLDTLGNEHLLMDFSVNVFNGYMPYSSSCAISITAIDSVLVNNDYRKRYTYQYLYPCSAPGGWYVEGIGYLWGALFANIYNDYRLTCFKWKGQVLYSWASGQQPIYGDNGVNCHEVYPYGTIVAVEKEPTEELFSRLYPNPTKSLVTLEMEQDIPAQISIHNAFGQLVFENAIHAKTYSVNTQEFAKGLYFYTVKTETYQNTHKLIIE